MALEHVLVPKTRYDRLIKTSREDRETDAYGGINKSSERDDDTPPSSDSGHNETSERQETSQEALQQDHHSKSQEAVTKNVRANTSTNSRTKQDIMPPPGIQLKELKRLMEVKTPKRKTLNRAHIDIKKRWVKW